MTKGHRHIVVKVNPYGWFVRAMTKPLVKTKDLARVERSPYPYGVILNGKVVLKISDEVDPNEIYYLSLLGIAHRWTGLTLRPDKE